MEAVLMVRETQLAVRILDEEAKLRARHHHVPKLGGPITAMGIAACPARRSFPTCKLGSCAGGGPAVSSVASSSFRTRAEAEASVVQITFFEFLDHSPHATTLYTLKLGVRFCAHLSGVRQLRLKAPIRSMLTLLVRIVLAKASDFGSKATQSPAGSAHQSRPPMGRPEYRSSSRSRHSLRK